MITLGYLSRVTGYITRDQADGAKNIAFKVLFPFLIYNATFHADLRADYILIIIFIYLAYIAIMFLCGKAGGWVGERYRRTAGFLAATTEGGGVALPLYITLVPSQHMLNIVMFDIGGMFCVLSIIAFVEKNVAGAVSLKTVVGAIVKNPIIIAMVVGLTLNALGVGHGLTSTGLAGLNDAIASMITKPIEGIVLFVLGYELRLEIRMIGPLLRMLVLRLAAAGVIIGGFFLLFADRMAQLPFIVAVLLYFLSPPSFLMPTLVGPYCDTDDEKSFMSAFLPLNVLLTIVVYLGLAILVGYAG
jgi:hypothetical protein